ncbi:hypothetical protein EW146_g3821 [Bondarzewia mesenterica]|uniref:PLP-dependent transferase n=1 Tax=Bondarzewia mesenterica TaxID=1095465 RepID=A0A4S4LWF5_9AGAM|nr:hypothetical protein EW146_g3821 [Bondarzewia mesenterica]
MPITCRREYMIRSYKRGIATTASWGCTLSLPLPVHIHLRLLCSMFVRLPPIVRIQYAPTLTSPCIRLLASSPSYVSVVSYTQRGPGHVLSVPVSGVLRPRYHAASYSRVFSRCAYLMSLCPHLGRIAESFSNYVRRRMANPPLYLISRTSKKPWNEKTSEEKYNTMGSWFLGPRGENADILKEKMSSLVDQVKNGRLQYWPDDPVRLRVSRPLYLDSQSHYLMIHVIQDFITKAMSDSQDFKDSVDEVQLGIEYLGTQLAQHSVPFFSPRYAGHMNGEISMPATLGYIVAQQYNQNNAAPEGGPFSSYIEWRVGQQLCAMIGFNSYFNSSSQRPDDIVGWGHITADGSIANLESLWIARNLKYYPLALKQAMAPGAPFDFIASTFMANLCNGEQKNFYLCDAWDLLNLTPTEVANIPTRLSNDYNISSDALGKCLEQYSIQTVGKQKLDADFNITKPAQYMISVANHYSWPKACAVTGIGSENLVTIGVDYNARMDPTILENKLKDLCEAKQAVYCVVLIEGTTEHGSLDPVGEVIAIRERMQKLGMSFMIHADAAWGGYFATKVTLAKKKRPESEYAFSIPLNEWANDQLRNLKRVDTVTVDPHKSGYVPYPAGSLCLRDDRHRFLTTWTSPYINAKVGDDIAMGIYGIEGRCVQRQFAAFLSHEIIGLLDGGYADLLGTAMLTGVKMYGHWATMSLESPVLTVTPFNMLPIEKEKPNPTPDEIKAQQEEIRTKIVNRRNDELEHDLDAMSLVRQLGSDTMINAFACNFKVDGVINTDVVEANFLNTRIYQRLSVLTVNDDLKDRPIIILRTELMQKNYLGTLDMFKSRMGLSGSEDLVALTNVSMETAEEEIKNCLVRIQERPSIHSFLVQGTNVLYLVYLPMFNVENHKRQLIVTGTLSGDAMQEYTAAKEQNNDSVFTIHTKSTVLSDLKTLDQILADKKFVGDIYQGLPQVYGSSPILKDVEFTVTSVHTDQSLDRQNLHAYPNEMPFYLYGSSKEYHIDHVLGSAPNAQLSASGVTLDVTPALDDSKKYTFTFDREIEWAMQPFTEGSTSTSVSEGTITLPQNAGDIFVDYEHLNEEIAADVYIMVPRDSTMSDEQIKADIDNMSWFLAQMLRCKGVLGDAGRPEASTIKEGAYFAIVSRFTGKQPTDTKALRSAQHQAWVAKFEGGA